MENFVAEWVILNILEDCTANLSVDCEIDDVSFWGEEDSFDEGG